MCLNDESPASLDQEVCLSEKYFIGSNLLFLRLETAEEPRAFLPGQFVMLRTTEGLDPLLGRPFAICGRYPQGIELLVAVAGRGTSLLSRLQTGSCLSIRGPLGNGFPVDPGTRIHQLAGTVGIAPFLLRDSRVMGPVVHLGVPSRVWQPFVDWVSDRVDGLDVYSEDGQIGKKGNPLPVLAELDPLCDVVWACGPSGMLKAVASECNRRGIKAWLSLETRMACGMGGCHGCVVMTASGPKKTCTDGPVFEATEVCWDAH